MKPFETLASTTTADGRELTLHRRESDYFIYLEGEELMSTRRHHSERELAAAALRELGPRPRPRVLIGGLGLGFTLREALAQLPADGRVVVAELFAAVVEWNRTHMEISRGALADSRVEVVERDVWSVIRAAAAEFDAILLDVDNGPSAWCLEANSRLYDEGGLAAVSRALRPEGVLGVWSAFRDDRFLRRLERAGFAARAKSVRARGERGSRHTIFLAKARLRRS